MQEMQEMWIWSLNREEPLEEEMASHPSILAWKIPGTEEPGRQQFMELQRVGRDGMTEHVHAHRSVTLQKLTQKKRSDCGCWR